MNARQKAKKYKRMYEKLLNQPVQFKVEQHKIDTLRFERLYPKHLVIDQNSGYFKEVILKDIAYSIAESLDKYMFYRTEFWPHMNRYRFVGEIKVVKTNKEE